jgi:hypothetical protein
MLKLKFHEGNLNTANLYFAQDKLKKTKLSPVVIDITTRLQPERERVEAFIRDIYKREYNADITISYPILMSIRDAQGNILAALGFRYAADEPLFLEQYTHEPIEDILQAPRAEIAEVGNLASAGGGASLFLFAAIASYLTAKDIKYITITGTDFLHRYFKGLGLQPQKICDANLTSLNSDGQNWGSYYDKNPRVLAGSLPHAIEKLKQSLGTEYKARRPRFYTRLHCRKKS